ncbi:hypothetical protein ACSAZK_09595 [Methanosarcina sp. Mfa9]|uniref:hypothetical protein n=1 Tax=Methanosarcina sp. Mfa9 TaxID=3439063 RepID=UPI003F83665C
MEAKSISHFKFFMGADFAEPTFFKENSLKRFTFIIRQFSKLCVGWGMLTTLETVFSYPGRQDRSRRVFHVLLAKNPNSSGPYWQ